jgi:hypothetical protein
MVFVSKLPGIPGRFRFFFGGGTVTESGMSSLPNEETIVSSPEAVDTFILNEFSTSTILFPSKTSALSCSKLTIKIKNKKTPLLQVSKLAKDGRQ